MQFWNLPVHQNPQSNTMHGPYSIPTTYNFRINNLNTIIRKLSRSAANIENTNLQWNVHILLTIYLIYYLCILALMSQYLKTIVKLRNFSCDELKQICVHCLTTAYLHTFETNVKMVSVICMKLNPAAI